MGLFSKGKKGQTVALIDIGSASVGGAYAYYIKDAQPVIYYTVRADIGLREGESITDSMLRSLEFVKRHMTTEGAPLLRRETGSGSVDKVLVAIAAPWQETRVTNTHIEESRPFTFTHAHVDTATRAVEVPEDRVTLGHTIVATILNGYQVPTPFGKRASRAEIVLLASSMEKAAAERIESSLRQAFHTHTIELIGFAPAAYTVFRDLYPHQDDFILLDVTGKGTDLLFVKHGIIKHVASVPQGTHDLLQTAKVSWRKQHEEEAGPLTKSVNVLFKEETHAIEKEWIEHLHTILQEFSLTDALPHAIFLLSDTRTRDYLKRTLEMSTLRALWLSDKPLAIIPVTPSHLCMSLKTRGISDSDLFLGILALYSGKKSIHIYPALEAKKPESSMVVSMAPE